MTHVLCRRSTAAVLNASLYRTLDVISSSSTWNVSNRPSRVGFIATKPMRSPTPWVYSFGLWVFRCDVEIPFNICDDYLRIFVDLIMRSQAQKALALALSFVSKATIDSAVLGTVDAYIKSNSRRQENVQCQRCSLNTRKPDQLGRPPLSRTIWTHVGSGLSNWEGSAANSRVLCDTIHRDAGLCVPTDILNTGNYYLCDNRYANADGFLTPSRGVRYHLREWDRGAGDPRNTEELFNLKHSSARNVIERKFGLLKVRWGILCNQSFYSIEVQDKIIIACCLLHNFIQNEMPDDPLELEIPDARDSVDETNVECISTIEK
ncbi:UNVERIFIED_CONTAM: hypothetical protein Scaly_2752500 [Sesamum calycinum]|uniref:DDE Tnp4 domain-containing protein n=1 Tax=Sesamum calycinum TaxID=2727403 RepID=A0AAW2J1L8_9LAMI